MEVNDGDCGCPEVEEHRQIEEGAPLWTVTFGDMMSLLLTFFILLFSMSELKMDKFLLASQSLRQAMGGTAVETIEDPMGLMPDPVDPDLNMQNPGGSQGATVDPSQVDAENADPEALRQALLESATDDYLEMIRARFEEFVDENQLEETVRVVKEADGVYLRIETMALFGSGESFIQAPGEEVLSYLSAITRELSVAVVVSGHADNQPIRGGPFFSNWELSAARAAGVARSMVEDGHPPTMVRVESYGEYKPIADNSTPEGRAQNRRVELFYARDDVRAAAVQWAVEEGAVVVPKEGLGEAEG